MPLDQVNGRGARVGFVEYEAENARSNGVPVGPDRTFTTVASEASGRRAVRLERPGDFVEFTLARPANALTVRYAVPDGIDGAGLDTTLGVYVAGARLGALRLTSRYGWFYGRYPFTNRPQDGEPHHFFDHARLRLGRMLPAGARVRIMVGPQDRAPWYVLDLADFEAVPPAPSPPRGALSVLRFGADRSGVQTSLQPFRRAVAAGRRTGRPVWIPPGIYRLDGHLQVDRVTLVGAGPWRSVLTGRGVGVYGRADGRESRRVVLSEFAVLGEVVDRDDKAQLAGIGGALGDGSVVRNLWIQHTKTGVWLDGPLDGLLIHGLRIFDTTADGLNLRRGVSGVRVQDCFVRNTGDDGLAMWSRELANHDNAFRRNTVVAPILANGIALYGGRDLEVSGNLVADTVTQGGGLHLGSRFKATPFGGRIVLADNLVVRAGSFDPNWRFGVGALWLYALDGPIAADVAVRRTVLRDSTQEAIQVLGKPVTGLSLTDVVVERPGSAVLQLQAPGSAELSGVVVRGVRGPGVLDCRSGFQLRFRSGDPAWAGRRCDGPPDDAAGRSR